MCSLKSLTLFVFTHSVVVHVLNSVQNPLLHWSSGSHIHILPRGVAALTAYKAKISYGAPGPASGRPTGPAVRPPGADPVFDPNVNCFFQAGPGGGGRRATGGPAPTDAGPGRAPVRRGLMTDHALPRSCTGLAAAGLGAGATGFKGSMNEPTTNGAELRKLTRLINV